MPGAVQVIERFCRAAERREQDIGRRPRRASNYTALLASRMDLDVAPLRLASRMRDIGNMGLADAILLKPGTLTPTERQEMERHTEAGHELLSGSSSAVLDLAATIALTHHEKFDGSGYPVGMSGDDIPIEGQVAAIADVFDALTTDRPYREAVPAAEALRVIQDERDSHFSPQLVDAFLELMKEIVGERVHHLAVGGIGT